MNYVKNKRGQVWSTDFIVGLMLFLFVILVSTKILMDMGLNTDDSYVYRDAVYISGSLLSAGYPTNWTNETVIIPGIADDNRLNLTHLSHFQNLTYEKTTQLLHIKSDYIFFIRNSTNILNISQCVYGYNLTTDENCTPILSTEKYARLVTIDRLIIYNSTVATMTVYAWD